MTRHQRFIKEVAATVVELFNAGNLDPSAQEIADAYYGREVLSPGAIEDVSCCLERVCKRLRGEQHLHVHPPSPLYYQKYRGTIPSDDWELKRCLAGGAGAAAAGIRKATPDDPMYLAWLGKRSDNGAKTMRAALDTTVDATGRGLLSPSKAASVFSNAHRLALPSRPEAAAQIMEALPAGSSDREQ